MKTKLYLPPLTGAVLSLTLSSISENKCVTDNCQSLLQLFSLPIVRVLSPTFLTENCQSFVLLCFDQQRQNLLCLAKISHNVLSLGERIQGILGPKMNKNVGNSMKTHKYTWIYTKMHEDEWNNLWKSLKSMNNQKKSKIKVSAKLKSQFRREY